jgi:hypothetical protein
MNLPETPGTTMMFDHLITLNEFNRAYLIRLMDGFPDEQLDHQSDEGLHSVRWILAHLAICADYGFSQLDMPFICPMTWHAAYGPASMAGTSDRVRPEREELLSVIETGYSKLCDSLRTASVEQLSRRHEVELLRNTVLKTRAELTAHILTTHFATHLGQLSTLRRLQGFKPLF